MRGEFSVYQFFATGTYEEVLRFVDAGEAVRTALSLEQSVGARIGTTQRIIITDDGDCTCWDWRYGCGLIFPAQYKFTLEAVTDDYVILRDCNAEGSRSLTNSAEQVVALMHDTYPGRRVYYYDTDGRLDEMKHTDGKFEGFAPGGPAQ